MFDRFGASMRYVVPFRHPLSVADSLASRNKIPRGKSHMLWLAHVVPALRFTEAQPRVLLDYDRLMEAPGAELRKLAQTFALPVDPAKAQIFEQDFLEQGLRHSAYGIDDLEQDDAAPAPMKTLFSAMVAAARTPTPVRRAALTEALDIAERFLLSSEALLTYGWDLELDIRKLHVALDIEHKQSVAFEQAVLNAANREAQLHAELEQANARSAAVAETHAREIAARDAAMQRSQATIREYETRLTTCGSELASREDQIAQLNSQVTARDAEISSFVNSTSWRVTAPLRFARRCFRR
ncbi:hypothetical protein [Paraburkholderia acidisoli]|uniref:Sulfotransferase family protein n=1 Tax=Paraburkholderia acidisoli TaxID=2571748 RepID=A0A7Z2GG12_9BURK|nr:hypothetical protein [Paraburkholderia acidisoli]QGZ60805.1 hypothetical protein FAZ98_03110 [Paraburkholderia acidisoli]